MCWNHRLIRYWQAAESKNHSRGNYLCMCVCRTGTCHVRRSALAARHDAPRSLSQVHGLYLLLVVAPSPSISQGARVPVRMHMAPRCGESNAAIQPWRVSRGWFSRSSGRTYLEVRTLLAAGQVEVALQRHTLLVHVPAPTCTQRSTVGIERQRSCAVEPKQGESKQNVIG